MGRNPFFPPFFPSTWDAPHPIPTAAPAKQGQHVRGEVREERLPPIGTSTGTMEEAAAPPDPRGAAGSCRPGDAAAISSCLLSSRRR